MHLSQEEHSVKPIGILSKVSGESNYLPAGQMQMKRVAPSQGRVLVEILYLRSLEAWGC